MGLSQSQSVIVLFAGAIVLEGLALVFIYADDRFSALAIAALVPLIVVVVRFLGYDQLIMSARRARVLESVEQAASAGTHALLDLRKAQSASFADLWAKVEEVAEALGLEQIKLELTDIGARELVSGQRHFSWSRTGTEATDPSVHLQSLWNTDAPLLVGSRRLGRVEVSGQDERRILKPLSDAWVQILADTLAAALAAGLLAEADHPVVPSPAQAPTQHIS